MAWFRRKLKGIRTETKEKKLLCQYYVAKLSFRLYKPRVQYFNFGYYIFTYTYMRE